MFSDASQVAMVVSGGHERYRFTHPLIREALYQAQKDAARIATHRVIGEALEQMYATSFTIDASPWPFDKGKLGRQEQPGDSNLAFISQRSRITSVRRIELTRRLSTRLERARPLTRSMHTKRRHRTGRRRWR